MSARTYLASLIALTVGLFIGVGCVEAQSESEKTLEEYFQSAPVILPGDKISLKPLPLWHTNGQLSDALIDEFFEKGTQNGFGGYTFLPLGRTLPKYLSDEYFEYFGKVLKEAQKRGQKIVFYDDVDFPSGSAGGAMQAQFPDYCVKRLDMESWTQTGPADKVRFPFSRKLNQNWKDGYIQAAVAMNVKTWERIDLTQTPGAVVSDDAIVWTVPQGEWKVMVFYCLSDNRKVDNMDPEAMRKFLTLTYDRFYERFPEHFGTTIPICFFDDVTITQTQGGRNWTPGFNEKYRQIYGASPALDYPAAFMSIGPETAIARVRLWTVRNELFSDGYPKVVHEWCAEHGMMSSGHPQGPYVIQPCNMCGDEMLFHRSSDAPLFDSIHYYGHGRDGFKVPTSSACNFDKPLCLVEIYGNYRDHVRNGKPEFDDKMLYRSAMEIFCRGGNVLLPHGIWSYPKTMYIPPDISWRNPNLNGTLPQYGDWVSRISLIMRYSRHIADVGIVYPIDNLKAYFFFHDKFAPGEHPYGYYIPPETDYMEVGKILTSGIYRDYTYLHPDVMLSRCSIGKNDAGQTVYKLNNKQNFEQYRVLVLTGSEVISWKTLEQVYEFWKQGGSVISTTRLPNRAAEGSQFDAKVVQWIEEMFGVDPRVQGEVEAASCGQNDIVLPEHYREIRQLNKDAQFPMTYPGIEHKTLSEVHRPRAVFLPQPTPDALKKALDELIDVPDVKIVSHDGGALPENKINPRGSYDYDGMIQYIHKVKDGRDFYLVANSSNSDVVLDVTIRGSFKGLEIWNPLTGERTPIEESKLTRRGDCITINALALPAVTALFITQSN
ncbi:MAG: hypothetical protein IJQ39_02430 [Thermoguttaceae bacterium]|nr:hypothetical protein [Thermoguttaceae bacterium]